MLEKIKNSLGDNNRDLEERIFSVILNTGMIITVLSAVVTCFESLSLFATATSFMAAILFAIDLFVYYKLGNSHAARLILCYVLNCFVIPILFFTCGGIDSGMPLYMLAGMFIIIPTLKGRKRIICFLVSLFIDVLAISLSYFMMESSPIYIPLGAHILSKLSYESRFMDMIFSMILISSFLCIATILILNDYQKERVRSRQLLMRLEEISKKDELTGLYNRRELFWHMNTMERFWKNHYYVAMYDIDHFKVINDTYGHLFGDKVLKEIADKIRSLSFGEDEIAARYGGEEFAVLFKGENDATAFKKADEIRKAIESMEWEDREGLVITISGGVYACKEGMTVSEVLNGADVLLYKAKEGGRNRVEI